MISCQGIRRPEIFNENRFGTNQKIFSSIVVDAVGGDEYYNLIRPYLNQHGVYSTVVGPEAYGGSKPIGVVSMLGLGSKLLCRSLCGSNYKMITELPIKYLAEINSYIQRGLIKFVPVTKFPLEQGSKAHQQSETNRTVGKIVLVLQ